MIITSPMQFVIGRIYTEKEIGMPFEYGHKKHEKYAFLVIREATKEEYRKEIDRDYADLAHLIFSDKYFYEISTD